VTLQTVVRRFDSGRRLYAVKGLTSAISRPFPDVDNISDNIPHENGPFRGPFLLAGRGSWLPRRGSFRRGVDSVVHETFQVLPSEMRVPHRRAKMRAKGGTLVSFQIRRDGTIRQTEPRDTSKMGSVYPFRAAGDTLLVRISESDTVRFVYLGDSLVMQIGVRTWSYYRERPGRSIPEVTPAADRPAVSADTSAYYDFQVDQQADVKPPIVRARYHEALGADGIEGDVVAEWVVDTLGRGELSSFRVVSSSHRYFSDAVREALPRMRFLPAERGGKRVRQIVRQPFSFAIR
jgi:TonB family protein